MAFGAKQIFPNDQRPRVAIGVDLPLNGRACFRPNFETKDAIKSNLINYFLTNPGERPGNPEFGAGLREFIFTQITDDNLDYLKEDVQEKLASNFPRVVVEGVNVNPDQERNRILVQIKYSVANTGIEDQLELSFS